MTVVFLQYIFLYMWPMDNVPKWEISSCFSSWASQRILNHAFVWVKLHPYLFQSVRSHVSNGDILCHRALMLFSMKRILHRLWCNYLRTPSSEITRNFNSIKETISVQRYFLFLQLYFFFIFFSFLARQNKVSGCWISMIPDQKRSPTPCPLKPRHHLRWRKTFSSCPWDTWGPTWALAHARQRCRFGHDWYPRHQAQL